MRLPTSEEMAAFVSEEFEKHSKCDGDCVHHKDLDKLDELFTCTALYNGMINAATENSLVVFTVAGAGLGYMAIYGMWLGLQLGYKLSEQDGLDRLVKCLDKP
jgi:hypothetical protein